MVRQLTGSHYRLSEDIREINAIEDIVEGLGRRGSGVIRVRIVFSVLARPFIGTGPARASGFEGRSGAVTSVLTIAIPAITSTEIPLVSLFLLPFQPLCRIPQHTIHSLRLGAIQQLPTLLLFPATQVCTLAQNLLLRRSRTRFDNMFSFVGSLLAVRKSASSLGTTVISLSEKVVPHGGVRYSFRVPNPSYR